MSIWTNFLRWEVLVFMIILILLVLFHKKVGFIRNFFRQSDEEKLLQRNRIQFSLILLLISLFSILIYNYIGIFFRNFTGDFRLAILVIAVFGYFVSSLIFLSFSMQRLYEKEIGALGILLLIFFFMNKNPNNLLGRLSIIAFGFSIIILPFYLKKDWKKKNLYPWITALIMLAVFFGGIILIDSLYGDKGNDISLSLNINGNVSNKYQEAGQNVLLKCQNGYGKVFVDSKIKCSLEESSATINSINVTFISLEGNSEKINIDSMEFTIPYELSRVSFELNITSPAKDQYYLTTANDYKNKILTIENDKSREEKFILYFLALIGILFFSIPSMMNNFKELSKS